MAVVFQRGQILGRGDLDIFLTNAQNNPANAAEITFSLYWVDETGPVPVEVLIPPADRTPENPAVGEYYASIQIPAGASLGTYRIRWNFRELPGQPIQQAVQEWAVVEDTTAVGPTPYTSQEQELIDDLRVLLRDNNPDRNYRFRPPEHEGVIGQYNQIFGYIWEDSELYVYLKYGLNWWNLLPPNTGGMICSLLQLLTYKPEWTTPVMFAAMMHAAWALQFNWTADEFDYSIGGISLSIERASKYEALKRNAEDMLEKAADAKARTTKFIRGLKQPRFGIGIRSAFGPHVGRGVLSPRSFL